MTPRIKAERNGDGVTVALDAPTPDAMDLLLALVREQAKREGRPPRTVLRRLESREVRTAKQVEASD